MADAPAAVLHLAGATGTHRSECGLKKPLPMCHRAFAQVHGANVPCCVPCFEGAGVVIPPRAGQLPLFATRTDSEETPDA